VAGLLGRHRLRLCALPHAESGLDEIASHARDRARRENEEALTALKERFSLLSPREREIMIQVVGEDAVRPQASKTANNHACALACAA
jgi:FixJ family two-component response regulator